MKQKTKYTNEPIEARVIRDFLPPPEELIFKEDNIKVTMSLSRSSVEFFKHTARQHQSHYHTMIRSLLDTYAAKFK